VCKTVQNHSITPSLEDSAVKKGESYFYGYRRESRSWLGLN